METYAESLQMKAERGQIMLMGEVKSEQEKAEIGAIVHDTLGVMIVENQLRTS